MRLTFKASLKELRIERAFSTACGFERDFKMPYMTLIVTESVTEMRSYLGHNLDSNNTLGRTGSEFIVPSIAFCKIFYPSEAIVKQDAPVFRLKK